MDAGAGRARPEQCQPQHDRGPRQRSPSAAGRHVYSSISILFPRHFRGQGAVAGSRDRGGAGRGCRSLLSAPGLPRHSRSSPASGVCPLSPGGCGFSALFSPSRALLGCPPPGGCLPPCPPRVGPGPAVRAMAAARGPAAAPSRRGTLPKGNPLSPPHHCGEVLGEGLVWG